MATKPIAAPAASASCAIVLLDLQDQLREMQEAVKGLTAEQIARLDWGDYGSLKHASEKGQEMLDWLTAWRAGQ